MLECNAQAEWKLSFSGASFRVSNGLFTGSQANWDQCNYNNVESHSPPMLHHALEIKHSNEKKVTVSLSIETTDRKSIDGGPGKGTAMCLRLKNSLVARS